MRQELVDAARADARISGAALTGSAALDAEDRWSDIDLALGVDSSVAPVSQVITDWTTLMYQEHAAVHHMDVTRGATTYRVFLLANTLQVDIAFSPRAEFGAIAPTFRLLFGTAETQPTVATATAAQLIGLGWLHALHARSSIARERVWQAEYMISGVRDHALALMCMRHDLPAFQARGIDKLPPGATAAMNGALVRSLDISELMRAFRAANEGLLDEVRRFDADLADRLTAPLRGLGL